ncbi:hypothetical protein V6Z11_A08G198400 [Gossypium hirsutum]
MIKRRRTTIKLGGRPRAKGDSSRNERLEIICCRRVQLEDQHGGHGGAEKAVHASCGVRVSRTS